MFNDGMMYKCTSLKVSLKLFLLPQFKHQISFLSICFFGCFYFRNQFDDLEEEDYDDDNDGSEANGGKTRVTPNTVIVEIDGNGSQHSGCNDISNDDAIAAALVEEEERGGVRLKRERKKPKLLYNPTDWLDR